MTRLSESVVNCEQIARKSGSSFFRSFGLLGAERRRAMFALYAFARLADDATDDPNSAHAWNADAWHGWLDSIGSSVAAGSSSYNSAAPSACESLRGIGPALADAVQRFAIPIETLHEIVRGVDTDSAGETLCLAHWSETESYCHRVASSVGVACLSIWAKTIGEAPESRAIESAMKCGVAFQMTNILRDLAEDSQRNRIYLPADELARFGIDPARWLGLPQNPTSFALNELGDWRGMIRLQIERARALYERGWQVFDAISIDSQRMFSLMWHTYRSLLDQIERKPESIWQTRVRVSKFRKGMLAAQHLFTPLFLRSMASENRTSDKRSLPVPIEWPEGGPRVAVVGAGLAGINASLHLARHGCRVTLFESKRRIGGRMGSFMDAESGKSVDYCQHVGMKCCTTLRQWIEDTDQTPHWTEQDALHFVSGNGKKICIRAWPLPAPFHLAGLLSRWPQLGLGDRVRIGSALLRLQRMERTTISNSALAIDWLRDNGQNDRCISNFWGTILVSALGEQVDRVTLSATHKVLVDGFAANRTAFHLLVPNRPLSELLDGLVLKRLRDSGVELCVGQAVSGMTANASGQLAVTASSEQHAAPELFDAVVCAVPWNKIARIVPNARISDVFKAEALQSSPITGIHTWWDRPWLQEPHAILIDRLCQWVFPAPSLSREPNSEVNPGQTREYYYQVVISASRALPRGDSDTVLKSVKNDLAAVFPAAAIATLLRGKVVTDPDAVYSVSVGNEASRLASDTLSSDRIWLSGDWTETGWPATMEGALRSGAIAAEGVLQRFGRDVQLGIDRTILTGSKDFLPLWSVRSNDGRE